MNKTIPVVLNSIFFIVGIVGLMFGSYIVAAGALLCISLLFIWSYGLTSGVWENEVEEKDESELEVQNMQMSGRLKALVDTNNKLLEENEGLKETISRLKDEKTVAPVIKRPRYNCPLTGSTPVNLNAFFNLYINSFSDSIKSSGLEVEYSCQKDNISTYLSESALTIICNNVFDNIIKFSPENARVFVILSSINDDGLVIFKNPGKGISSKEEEKIFDINYKGSNSKYGNGLGLSQVKDLIDDFGGRVWGKSTPQTGFALYLQIPEHLNQNSREDGYEG
jgi:signal transduction histidine kinase